MPDNQQKQLFTELTPEQAATVEGGTVWIGATDKEYQYWDKKTKSWIKPTTGQPWQYGEAGETTTIYYNYASGTGQDTYVTKDLAPDSYYVFGKGINNENWYDLYTSDPDYKQGKVWGVPGGTQYPAPTTY